MAKVALAEFERILFWFDQYKIQLVLCNVDRHRCVDAVLQERRATIIIPAGGEKLMWDCELKASSASS